jgi:hypothetical protein
MVPEEQEAYEGQGVDVENLLTSDICERFFAIGYSKLAAVVM